MITDTQIRSELKSAPNSGKSEIVLKDPGKRGQGRLALRIKADGAKVTAEWFATWYRGNERKMAKLGNYPELAIAVARKKFDGMKEEIANGVDPLGRIAAREKAKADAAQALQPPTVKALFEAYVAQLRARGSETKGPQGMLLGPKNPGYRNWGRKPAAPPAIVTLGPDTLAKDVTKPMIMKHLNLIWAAGRKGSAEKCRAYLSAAFKYALTAHSTVGAMGGDIDWGLEHSPAAHIKLVDAKGVGNRVLTFKEFREFHEWLEKQAETRRAAAGAQLALLLGQRSGEIVQLTSDAAAVGAYAARAEELAKRERETGRKNPRVGNCKQALGLYSAAERSIFWSITKNELPHFLPVFDRAVAILDKLALVQNEHGLMFPNQRDPQETATSASMSQLIAEYVADTGVAEFSPRDLRRTWKTLSGVPLGGNQEIRDRLQNHKKADVSTKHYDRFAYLPQKRAAMKAWGAFVERILSGELDNKPVDEIDETETNVVQMQEAA